MALPDPELCVVDNLEVGGVKLPVYAATPFIILMSVIYPYKSKLLFTGYFPICTVFVALKSVFKVASVPFTPFR